MTNLKRAQLNVYKNEGKNYYALFYKDKKQNIINITYKKLLDIKNLFEQKESKDESIKFFFLLMAFLEEVYSRIKKEFKHHYDLKMEIQF